MSQTPIYDQLWGERINADVSAPYSDLAWATHWDRHHEQATLRVAGRGATLTVRDDSRVLPPSAGVDLSPMHPSAHDLDAAQAAQRAAAMPAEKHARTTSRHLGPVSVAAAGHLPVTPTTAGAGEPRQSGKQRLLDAPTHN
jgi:hypothetical protein